jgi:molybdate-binding protein
LKEINKNIKKNINMYNSIYKNNNISNNKKSTSMRNLFDVKISEKEVSRKNLKKYKSISNLEGKQNHKNRVFS